MSGTKGVILIGGPSKGTRMRPLTLDTPKPLLPIAGKPMIWHPISALSLVPGLKEIIIIGFYEDSLMLDFLKSVKREFSGLSITYLREYRSLGTAGGLYHFRDTISANMSNFFVINADICCSFPLADMIQAHERHRGVGTMFGVTVPKETATRYGSIVHDPATAQVLHYVEKPESWISSLINGGIYLFDKTFFDEVKVAMQEKQKRVAEDPLGEQDDILRLEQDVIVPLAAARKMFVFESEDQFWLQIKSAGSAVSASALYLKQFAKTNPSLLTAPTKPQSPNEPTIIAPVYIDPSAVVDCSAKIGPNVSLGPHVHVGPGVRIKDSIVMEGVTLERHACVLNSIIGNYCKIGPWARIDGALESGLEGKNEFSVTILATEVSVAREVCIRSCIVLPNKTLGTSANNQVLL